MRAFALLLAALCCLIRGNAFTVTPSNIRVVTALDMTILTYGSKKKDFKAGSPMSAAMKALGVPVKYSCKKARRITEMAHLMQTKHDG